MKKRIAFVVVVAGLLSGCTSFVKTFYPEQVEAQKRNDLARSRGEIIEFRIVHNPYARYVR